MKSRGIKIKIACCMLSVLLALFTVGYTFAWFSDYYSVDIKLYTNSDGGYFAGGDGSKSSPYVISSYKHLYNLAWLQNTGKISNGTYFEISNDSEDDTLDMAPNNSYFVIPPIGNDTYPFNGVFDGGGYTITNLVVSTDKTKLTNFPTESADGYAFSNYVGLFGCTGTGSDIKNFILEEPIVEVASSNTKYSTSSESCVGLAIGYVANKASSIGVIGGVLAVQQTGYTTYNSILGTISSNLTTSITGDDDDTKTSTTVTSDGDTGYFIPDVFYENISANYSNYSNFATYSSGTVSFNSSTWLTSTKGKSTTYNIAADLGLGNFTIINGSDNGIVLQDIDSQWGASNISESYRAKDDNGKTYIKAFQISAGSYTINGTSYTIDNAITVYLDSATNQTMYSSGTAELTVAEYFASLVVDLKGERYEGLYDLLYYEHSPNNISSKTSTALSYTVVSEDNVILESGKSYYVFDNTIQINISNPDKAKIFVIASSRSKSEARMLGITKVFADTSSGFTFYNGFTDFEGTSQESGDPKSDPTKTVTLPTDTDGSVIMGVEISLNGENEGKGIYTINMGENKGINIFYLAVTGVDDGTTGTGTDTSSDGTYSSDCQVSAIDFIYGKVTIYGGNFVIVKDNVTTITSEDDYNFYVPTGTRVSLTSASAGTGAVLIIAYVREADGLGSTTLPESEDYTITVTYYTAGSDTPAQSQSTAYISEDSNLANTDIPTTGDKVQSASG